MEKRFQPELKKERPSSPNESLAWEAETPKSIPKVVKSTPTGEKVTPHKKKSAEKTKVPKSAEKAAQSKMAADKMMDVKSGEKVAKSADKTSQVKSAVKAKQPKSAEKKLSGQPKLVVKLTHTKSLERPLQLKMAEKTAPPRPSEKATLMKAAADKEMEDRISPRLPRKVMRRELDTRTECAMCGKAGDNSTLVR